MNPYRHDHPGVRALMNRAWAYCQTIDATTGRRPEQWRVSEAEYALMVRFMGADPDRPPRIYGMAIYLPHRQLWQPGCRTMVHVISQPLGRTCQETCETRRPHKDISAITCPCGDVIWEIMPDHREDHVETAPRLLTVAADSEHSSVEEWAQAVEDLLGEVSW